MSVRTWVALPGREGDVAHRDRVRISSVFKWPGCWAAGSTVRRPKLLVFCVLALLAISPASRGQTNSQLNTAQSLYRDGMRLVQQGKLEAALKAFNLGIKADPANLIILNALGATYALKGDAEEAQNC